MPFKFNLSATLVSLLLAIPVLTAPSGVIISGSSLKTEGIIPREYIDAVLAYYAAKNQAKARTDWKDAKRALNELQKRVPADQHCDREDEWLSRTCMTDISLQAYEDECQTADGVEYEADGECPAGTTCRPVTVVKGRDPDTGEEIIEDDILCEPATPPKQDMISGNQQYGYREVSASSSETQDVSIPVLVDNASSSVSAEILSKH